MNFSHTLTGMIVDPVSQKIFPGAVMIEAGKINSVTTMPEDKVDNQYLLPGFIDAHIHIESSMLVPSEFAKAAVKHGTVATVSDPHEIANVLGKPGVDFMIENGGRVPFKFYFGAPSCVPATPFETSGAEINAEDIDKLLSRSEIHYLAEMMNFPGVLGQDEEVMKKLEAARRHQKPVDGHAPGVKGKDAMQYAREGITTDHECFTIEEARDKIQAGMKIQIREGSAARNFEALISLLNEFPDKIMFCSDDKHPDELVEGHIDLLIKKAMAHGYDLLTALQPCTINPARHYNLDVGMLQPGDPADLTIVNNPKDLTILKTYINGEIVAENGKSYIEYEEQETPNVFINNVPELRDLEVPAEEGKMNVIDVKEGQLITGKMEVEPKIQNGKVISDPENDILKLVVLNRYKKSGPALGFIHNIGIKSGAIGSTVAHDSHNIIVVGVDDHLILKAIREISKVTGGIACVDDKQTEILPLPVAGIMTNRNALETAQAYKKIDRKVKEKGAKLQAPFMSLSFMALLVIPSLKLGDKGLFDVESFTFANLFKQ